MTANGKPTALIVGGAGFIGHHVARRLLDEGMIVAVADDFSRAARANLAPHLSNPRFTLFEGDVTTEGFLEAVVRRFRPALVYPLAAIHFIPRCNAHPAETLLVNVLGTQRLLDAIEATPEVRLVLASTADVYAPSNAPHRETDPVAPGNVYGASKLFCEQLLDLARRRYPRARFLAARLFNVFGPGETNPHVLPDIFADLRRGQPLRLGNLDPRRDYVYALDVADLLRRLADYPGSETVFNVGTGRGTSVAELIAELQAILGRPLDVEQDPAKVRPVERMNLVADISRARKELGWAPAHSLRDGLRRLVERELASKVA